MSSENNLRVLKFRSNELYYSYNTRVSLQSTLIQKLLLVGVYSRSEELVVRDFWPTLTKMKGKAPVGVFI